MNFEPEPTDIACLLIHGFTSTPSEMSGLARYLQARGVAALALTLPGHGANPEDLRGKTWRDWYAAVSAALDDLPREHSKVFLVGLSLGGALSLYAASQRGQDLAGVVAISAPIYFPPGLSTLLKRLERRVPYLHKPFRDIQDPLARAQHRSYMRAPLDAVASLVEFAGIVRLSLPQVRVPALIVYARRDHVVHPLHARYIYARISSRHKRLLALKRGFHIATVDKDRKRLYAEVYGFLRTKDEGRRIETQRRKGRKEDAEIR